MGELLILISMAAGTVAFISLIRPLPRFWLPTRKRAAIVWIASFVLFYAGDSLIPRPTVPHPTSARQPEEEWSNARTGYASFQQRFNAGADCQELYEIRNEVRRLDQSYADRMNEDLRAIGCYSSTSSRTPYKSIPSTVRELTDTEVDSEATGVVPCIPRKLSEASMELVRLYDQLHAFKDDPEFLRVGFVLGGPYSAWMQAIEKQRDTNPGFELLDELGFLPGELMMLGMNYMDEDFSESDLAAIEHLEGKIQAGLASARCNDLGSEWQETIQAASEARQRYAAETEAQILARESLLGRPLTDEELLDVEFEKLRGVLEAGEEYPGQRAERAAVAELRSLTDRMRARDQRIPEHGAALARVVAAAGAAERGQGTYTDSLAAAETYVALTTVIEAEISALATELAAVEATASVKVAAEAATARMNMEQALAQITSSLAVQRDLLETQRAMVAELAVAEHSTPSGRVTLEMMGDARLAIKTATTALLRLGWGAEVR